ncbi:hypothetical protein [Chryseobacterium sp.]|uniref:hypothetical protein n=1 Tax=Chryseobacterium sp. TaxID=1871047 RepID=UPI0025B8C939|nr:hypothetical protein [Chryseobacterium sp.]
MERAINKIVLLSFLLIGMLGYAQNKTKFVNTHTVLAKIEPNIKTDFWILVYNEYGKDQELKVYGTKKDYTPQFSGFDLFPSEDTFYYIVYSSGGKINYITDLEGLKAFVGRIDNVEEAAIMATIEEGYVIDEQFKDVAGNYYEDKTNYYLDLGKLTSKECPYQKKHYTLTVNKSTGKITDIKDNGTYIELYNKKCKNNPRLLKIEKNEEPKEEPKKTTQRR